jgi:putative Mg2+ transporter-C (MgtC) family protein
MLIISTQEVVLRLLAAFIVSGIIGVEREYYRRPAGLRTNIMVGVGSAIMTIAAVQAMALFESSVVDPTRIAAQIITGIGFLGAGTILHKGPSVEGLTTAATLWVVAGLGIALGFGLYREAIIAAALVLFNFIIVTRLVIFIRKIGKDPNKELE